LEIFIIAEKAENLDIPVIQIDKIHPQKSRLKINGGIGKYSQNLYPFFSFNVLIIIKIQDSNGIHYIINNNGRVCSIPRLPMKKAQSITIEPHKIGSPARTRIRRRRTLPIELLFQNVNFYPFTALTTFQKFLPFHSLSSGGILFFVYE
jgi:hypothetical protein